MTFYGACTSDRDGATGTALDVNVTFPAGVQVGDVFVGGASINSSTGTCTATAGTNTWTLSDPSGPRNQNNVLLSFCYVRVLDATDIAAGGVRFRFGSTGRVIGQGDVFRGIDPASPIATAIAYSGTNASSMALPAVTTPVDGCDVGAFAMTRVSSGSAAAITLPAAWTKDGTSTSLNASGVNFNSAAGHLTTPGAAGSYGGGTITTSPSATHIAAYTVGLRPATASPAQGSASGGIAWAGTAAGKKITAGLAAGAIALAGAAAGSVQHAGSGSGSTFWHGAAIGAATHHGAGAGSTAWAGFAQGVSLHEGQATGTTAWAGVATGEAPVVGGASGSAGGAVSWHGAAAGDRASQGAGSGGVSWTGSARGQAPAVGGASGRAAGALSWAGAAAGTTQHDGTASGQITWTTAAHGSTDPAGTAAGSITWTGQAAGGNNLRDITVEASLAPRRWTATLTDRAVTGSLAPQHSPTATLTPRRWTAHLPDRRWTGDLP